MLSAAVTLPSCFRERATLFKHRSAEFYCSGSSYIALLLSDAPLSILEAILLSVISYFWVGMRVSGALFGVVMRGTISSLYMHITRMNNFCDIYCLNLKASSVLIPTFSFNPTCHMTVKEWFWRVLLFPRNGKNTVTKSYGLTNIYISLSTNIYYIHP